MPGAQPAQDPIRIVLMGVAGCGKSSVGAALSPLLGIPYVDGDDLHPPGNVAKMSAGTPLTDADRWPWLDRVASELANGAPRVVGCSALKRAYRDRIRAGAGGPVIFVHLSGSRDLIAGRLGARTGHFMPPALLGSQFATLEPPADDESAITVNIGPPAADVARTIWQLVKARQHADTPVDRLLRHSARLIGALDGDGPAEVARLIARWHQGTPAQPAPQPHPVAERWLRVAVDAVSGSDPELSDALAHAAPCLRWRGYSYGPGQDIGAGFAAGNAYALLIGPGSPYPADDFHLGLFLIAPNVFYRDHHHAAPELYLPLTGQHGWRFGPMQPLHLLPALLPVWNPPGRPHAIKVGALPFLCLYGWTRDTAAPAVVDRSADWPAMEDLRIVPTA
jgi:gluconokinase